MPWGRGPRYRVELALDLISGAAARLGVAGFAPWLARPLLVAPDLRPRPFIVVLCGGCRFSGELSESTCARVEHGVGLFRHGLAPRLILSGGRWAPHRPACAPRMQAYALSPGIPAERILVEDRSTRTAENCSSSIPSGETSSIPGSNSGRRKEPCRRFTTSSRRTSYA